VCRSICLLRTGVPPNVMIRSLSLARRPDFFVLDEGDWENLANACIDAAEALRDKVYHPAFSWSLRALPRAKTNELVAKCVKVSLSILQKELAKPSAENRRRAMSVLQAAGAEPFDNTTGQLRAELCLGVLQMYPLDDDGQVERKMSHALDQANTIQGAVRHVLDSLTFGPQEEEEAPVYTPLEEVQVWIAAKSMHGTMPVRIAKILKTRAAIDVRDRLAHRVTDRVRDLRFDSRWFGMIKVCINFF